MTAKELHEKKIIPTERYLKELKDQYAKLWYAEQAEANGLDQCHCDNCAYSCVLDVGSDHNYCMASNCTCCRSRCYSWRPETEISKYLRVHYHYDAELFDDLAKLFGRDFIEFKESDKFATVQKGIELVREWRGE